MIHILGFGAIGKLVAHTLRCQCIPVTLLVRPASLHLYNHDWKLTVVSKTPHDQHSELDTSGYAFETTDNHASVGLIKNLIVCTKSCHSAQAVAQIIGRLDTTSRITLLNNGIGVDTEINRILEGLVAQPALLLGIISHGVYAVNHNTICHAGIGSLTLTSQRHIDVAKTYDEILKPLHSSVVEYSVFRQLQLEKLIVNAVVNPITAITEGRNGTVMQFPNLINSIILEAIPVLEASFPGCQFCADEMRQKVDKVICSTAENKSSMLQDMQAGRVTEIEYINGAICNLAMAHGFEMKISSTLVHLVRSKSQSGEDVMQEFIALLENVKRA